MKDVIRVNCNTGSIIREKESAELEMLGGRGLISKILLTEMDPAEEALGPANKLIIAGMILSGSGIPTVNRLSIGAKSPLTGGIKESNAGGTAGGHIASHGIKCIIFEKMPDKDNDKEKIPLKILVLKKDGSITFEDAEDYRGIGNYELAEQLFQKHGKDSALILNGVAGERLYANSSIQITEFGNGIPCRSAARGGLGSVMGSKGLKAIIIEKAANPYKYQFADYEKFNENRKKIVNKIIETGGLINKFGTAGFIAPTVAAGIIPVRNFSGGMLTQEQQDEFNLQSVLERFNQYGGKTNLPCQAGCVVKCSNIMNDKDGKLLTAGFEYETMGLFGPNCDIYDIEQIARMDQFCDDFGFDTIELATTLGVFMDEGKLNWGDADAAIKLFNSFWQHSEIADLFGSGTKALGETIGAKRIPVVKGQSIAAYDPRTLKANGVTYATTPMGADHTCGSTLGNVDPGPTDVEGQVELSKKKQVIVGACDCNCCLLSWAGILSAGEAYVDAVNATLGSNLTQSDIMKMGADTVAREKEFNKRAGFTEKDNELPEFFRMEKTAGGHVFDIPQNEINSI